MPTREEAKKERKKRLERELAEARAKQKDKVIVETTEPIDKTPIFTERTPAEAAELQAIQQEKEKAGIREEEAEKFPTQVETQEEILERERERREGVTVAKLPPEVQPPITAPALVEEETSLWDKWVAGIQAKSREAAKEFPEREGLLLKGELPLAPASIALSTAKAATGVRATKLWSGVLKSLKTNWKKLAKWGTIGYVLWSERSIGNIDSALSQVRESITLPVSLAATNPNEIPNAFDMITDLEEDVREYESDVKLKETFSPAMKLTGRSRPIYQRIKKLDAAIFLARQQIAKTETLGRPLTAEETALALDDINKVLDQMANPSKFLGLI